MTDDLPINDPANDPIAYAAAIIAKDIKKHYFLSQLAAKTGINILQLKTRFKERYSVGPFHYLTNLRLEYAMQQLITTNETVRYIALQCGYKRLTSFHKAFHRKYHHSPGYFRKKDQ